MSTERSLTHWGHELYASEASRRAEAARELWLHFAERLRARVRGKLDPRIRRCTDEDDIVDSLFAGLVAARPGWNGPPRDRDEIWRRLSHMIKCKVANAADYHRAQCRDVFRLQPLGEHEDRRQSDPADEAIGRVEFKRLFDLLPEDLQQVLAWRLEGYTNAEIAAKIRRVERTVELKMRAIRGLLEPHLDNTPRT
jgi:DNA-directed RNA polymerase specialized sigma24 family protein